MSGNTIEVTDSNFETEVLQAKIPVLVDFWADWCGPCKTVAPILEEVAKNEKYKNKVKIAKLNVDENTEMPAEYGVRGIPTLILFKGGKVVGTKVGAVTESQLTTFLDDGL